MGRKLRPLDPAAGVVEQFAHDLRELRVAAGEQPFWKMARRCTVSKSALAAAVAGSRLPSDQVARQFVETCGGDWPWWHQRLAMAREQQAGREVSQDAQRPSRSPDNPSRVPEGSRAPAGDPTPEPGLFEALWHDALISHGWRPKKITFRSGDYDFTAIYNGLHILGEVSPHDEPINDGKTCAFLAKLDVRPSTVGLLVSPSGFTDDARRTLSHAAASKSVVAFDGKHIDSVLLAGADLGQVFDEELRNTCDSVFETYAGRHNAFGQPSTTELFTKRREAPLS
jgi:hypothetical protein